MPYQNIYVSADIVVEHNGVTVYHSYKNDEYEHPLEYWYALENDDTEQFDIRCLANYDTTRTHIDILKEAIDNGALTKDE